MPNLVQLRRCFSTGRAVLVILLALPLVVANRAGAVSFEYAGVITEGQRGSSPPPAAVRPGAPFTATLWIEDGFQPNDSSVDPNIGTYAVTHDNTSAVLFTFDVAGHEYGSTPCCVRPVVVNNFPAVDSISISGENQLSPPFGFIGYVFRDPAGTALSSDAWTTNYLRSTWPEIRIFATSVGGASQSRFEGTVTPLAAFLGQTHGNTGAANLYLRPTGTPTIESRSGGPGGNHTMFFVFDRHIASATAAVTSGTGSVSGAATIQNRIVTVNLTGVADQQYLTITMSGVTDTSGQAVPDASATVGFLVGDSNGDGAVNSGDAQQVRNRSGESDAYTPASFRCDLNADGTINSGDAVIVRARSGNTLLP